MSANQGPSTSSASGSAAAQEYIVRVPKADKKRYHVMKFNAAHKVDFGKWSQARLERENNFKEFKPGEEMPKFGAGSEYGRENREEARKKKFGINAKKRKLDDQPWCLKVGGKTGKKYRGIREGGVTENASYYVFTQAPDGAFEAFPIEEWYNFTPVRTYRTLNAEEAEEEFGKRDKVFNYFSIMMKKRLKNEDVDVDPDGEEKSKKGAKKKHKPGDFKISEMDDWVNSSDDDDDDDEEEGDDKDKSKPPADKGKGKKKPDPKKAGKKKKKGNESDDSEALEDSDDGDDEGREVDYLSDSDSESEGDDERGGKGGKDALKGVEDEEAIRKMEDSDESDEEDATKKEGAAAGPDDAAEKEGAGGATAPATGKDKAAAKEKKDKKGNGSSSSSSSDTSDSDDFDNDTSFQTPLFMQDKINGSKKLSKKAKKEQAAAAAANKSNGPSKAAEKGALKRAATAAPDSDAKEAGSNKRMKLENQSSVASSSAGSSISIDGISEDSIRRYLMRKPLTASELLQKFKSKKTGLSSEQMVNTIAQILKRLNPDKQTVKGKMYLSIRP